MMVEECNKEMVVEMREEGDVELVEGGELRQESGK